MALGEVFGQRFPYQSQHSSTHAQNGVYVWGDVQTHQIAEHSVLYWVGEIHNIKTLGKALGQNTTHWSDAKILHELIIEQGTDIVAQCNGRFVLLYQSLLHHTIEVFNDQMSVQQLLYHVYNEGVIMASELKFLLTHPRCPQRIDWQKSIQRSLGFDILDNTQHHNAWFEGVELLKPAHKISILPRQQCIKASAYWQPVHRPVAYQNSHEIVEAYMALLQDATDIRCQDGPQAHSFLSGGLDSSILCGLAAPHKDLHTYSILTQTTYLEQTTQMCYDLSQQLGCHNTQVLMPYHNIALDPIIWKKRLWRSESPASHTDSITKTLLHASVSKINPDAHYVLTGTGSDQFNGGLVRYICQEDEENPSNNWPNFINKLNEESLKNAIPAHHYSAWGLAHLLEEDFISNQYGYNYQENDWNFYVQNSLHHIQFGLLWDENRAASSHNRSVRYPFMDYRFVEFIGNIPSKFHAALFYDKQILRRGSAKYIPDYIINKPKSPYVLGQYDSRLAHFQSFLNHNNRAVVEELMANNAVIGNIISRKKLQAEVEKLEKSSDMRAWQYLLKLLNLGVLEQLPQQTEASMEYESVLNQDSMWVSKIDADTVATIEEKLAIATKSQILHSIIAFEDDSFLITKKANHVLCLVKDNILKYEVDEAEPDWKNFLLAIDGKQTISQILTHLRINYEDIELYLGMCLKEEILKIESTHSHNKNIPPKATEAMEGYHRELFSSFILTL
jgi:asparagine synthase (glutamine-hydrolysing)